METKNNSVKKTEQKKKTAKGWQKPEIRTFKFAGCCLNGASGS